MISNLLREHEPLATTPLLQRCQTLVSPVSKVSLRMGQLHGPLDTTLVESIFQKKLSDIPENLPIFRELLEVKSKVLRFRAQLRRTEEDRDILKKAARYFPANPSEVPVYQ